jgi:hypothetical protein
MAACKASPIQSRGSGHVRRANDKAARSLLEDRTEFMSMHALENGKTYGRIVFLR